MSSLPAAFAFAAFLLGMRAAAGAAEGDASLPEIWHREKRVIDLHMHIEAKEERFARAVRIMDGAGVGIGANLSGGTVTHAEGEQSEFERAKASADHTLAASSLT